MKPNALVITLGHNASAIALKDGKVICGFEEERYTLKKSDSSYPRQSIEDCAWVADLTTHDTDIYVGHWFVNGRLEANKYADWVHLNALFPTATIHSLTQDFTHHDSHVYSAIAFANSKPGFGDSYNAIVADGFGTHGEVLSIYRVENGTPKVTKRYFGFDKSLGMLYQYATSYMGMQMHNHEYKILAYEVHIFDTEQLRSLEPLIQALAADWVNQWLKSLEVISETQDPIVNLSALENTRHIIHSQLDQVLLDLEIGVIDEWNQRVIISRFVQKCVEMAMLHIVQELPEGNLLLSGGLFYNVKINSLVANYISGKTCIMPVAGDQGAGLGVYNYHVGNLVWPGHLFWGIRDLDFTLVDDMLMFDSMEDAMPIIENELKGPGAVNIVRGAMEFGPRALCNTTTLAMPQSDVVEEINRINKRTTEMPMAPVVTQEQLEEYFEDTDKIHLSQEYMIVTRNYKPGKADKVLGCAHYYSNLDVYTGRPQVTNDPHLVRLLKKFGPLVNTSFNYHGVPIVFEGDSIIKTHQEQKANGSKFLTLIIKG